MASQAERREAIARAAAEARAGIVVRRTQPIRADEPEDDEPPEPGNAYRDGKVHVCSTMCDTCVFRPGNLMSLNPGRLRELIEQNRKAESGLVCHGTLGTDANAICRGFYDRYPTQPLQIASRLGRIRWQDPPTKGPA